MATYLAAGGVSAIEGVQSPATENSEQSGSGDVVSRDLSRKSVPVSHLSHRRHFPLFKGYAFAHGLVAIVNK